MVWCCSCSYLPCVDACGSVVGTRFVVVAGAVCSGGVGVSCWTCSVGVGMIAGVVAVLRLTVVVVVVESVVVVTASVIGISICFIGIAWPATFTICVGSYPMFE